MILIGGGSRSGKSRAALSLLQSYGPRRGFIATAEAKDADMAARIAQHRAERNSAITTWEEPIAVADVIDAEHHRFDAIVVDCLTLWLSNLMLASRENLQAEYNRLIDTAMRSTATILFVTNEVGCGIVPDNDLAIRFRDEAGRLNQLVAERAAEVHWMIFGIGLRVK